MPSLSLAFTGEMVRWESSDLCAAVTVSPSPVVVLFTNPLEQISPPIIRKTHGDGQKQEFDGDFLAPERLAATSSSRCELQFTRDRGSSIPAAQFKTCRVVAWSSFLVHAAVAFGEGQLFSPTPTMHPIFYEDGSGIEHMVNFLQTSECLEDCDTLCSRNVSKCLLDRRS